MFELIANTFHTQSIRCYSDLDSLEFNEMDLCKEGERGKTIVQQYFFGKNNVRMNCLQMPPVHR